MKQAIIYFAAMLSATSSFATAIETRALPVPCQWVVDISMTYIHGIPQEGYTTTSEPRCEPYPVKILSGVDVGTMGGGDTDKIAVGLPMVHGSTERQTVVRNHGRMLKGNSRTGRRLQRNPCCPFWNVPCSPGMPGILKLQPSGSHTEHLAPFVVSVWNERKRYNATFLTHPRTSQGPEAGDRAPEEGPGCRAQGAYRDRRRYVAAQGGREG